MTQVDLSPSAPPPALAAVPVASAPYSDRYEILRDLSPTLFGSIKLARDKVSGEKVAIKITDKSVCSSLRSSHGILDDWSYEVAVMKHLQLKFQKDKCSPIVQFIDFFEDESQACLVMEYFPLGDLYHYLSRKHRLIEIQAKRIFFQIVRSVRKLHIAGYAHLDISLENIVLGSKGNVKLCDLAVASEIFTSPSDQKGILVPNSRFSTVSLPFKPGKEMYRAPELNQSSNFLLEEFNGIAADTFSLGVVLFCISFGFNPYKMASKEDDNIYAMIVDESVEMSSILDVLQVKSEVSEDAEDLLAKMLCPIQCRIELKHVLEHSWFKELLSN